MNRVEWCTAKWDFLIILIYLILILNTYWSRPFTWPLLTLTFDLLIFLLFGDGGEQLQCISETHAGSAAWNSSIYLIQQQKIWIDNRKKPNCVAMMTSISWNLIVPQSIPLVDDLTLCMMKANWKARCQRYWWNFKICLYYESKSI